MSTFEFRILMSKPQFQFESLKTWISNSIWFNFFCRQRATSSISLAGVEGGEEGEGEGATGGQALCRETEPQEAPMRNRKHGEKKRETRKTGSHHRCSTLSVWHSYLFDIVNLLPPPLLDIVSLTLLPVGHC